MEQDDFTLMEEVKNDRETAFEALVRRYQRRLYRLAYGYLRNHEDALDAVQEALVKIYLARGAYRPSAHPFTWAARILANHCIDVLRHRRIRPTESLDAAQEEKEGQSTLHLVSREEPQQLRQERRELGRALNKAIFSLPRNQREIFMLRHFGEMRLEEIAAARGCALGTVKSSLHRAAAAIRNYLGACEPPIKYRVREGELS
ncbi:MAG: RNA polymerase sigma factor [Acidobacteria bacterium]|nr:RNA polymerase sigma factor [Acidobacteriota bacterium]